MKWSNPDNPYAPDWLPDPIPGFVPTTVEELRANNIGLPPAWIGGEHEEETKQQISASNVEAWKHDEERRAALIERNKTSHGDALKKAWAAGKYAERVTPGRPKGARDLSPRKQREQRKVIHNGKVYDNAFEAAKVYNIHPVNIRRKCRLEIEGYSYK